ncbi:hypothetical protein DFQ27_005763 [Actinomortierella ambigua]|uniref:beta-N-acetylhexosaminidase n=1 Tax=Actinomortierella ambigua TaxID=1343610 RepID=A0A9P6PXX4_9FUNG|nr:hypothetical protein DFQ27_005763 [Actinomortierella ambigua]
MIKTVYSISAAITLASNAFLLSLLFTPQHSAAHLWPKPLYHCQGEQTLRLSKDFEFVLPTNVHPRLAESASRYRRRILKSTFVSPVPPTVSSSSSSPSNVLTRSSSKANTSGTYDLRRIDVQVEDALAKAPLGPDTDESYQLLIAADDEEANRPFEISKSHCAAIRNGVILPGLQAHIRAKTIYGAMRAFETFAQLVVNTESASTPEGDQSSFGSSTATSLMKIVPNVPIVIHDRPLFQHRGILLDTSRNFLTVSTIKRTLDAMAMNKMNVFHWHLIDSQSFPLKLDDVNVATTSANDSDEPSSSDTNNPSSDNSDNSDNSDRRRKRDSSKETKVTTPDEEDPDRGKSDHKDKDRGKDEDEFLPLSQLAAKAAYSPEMTYSKTDVADLVAYALDRGIRVIPEIDLPGHAWAWSTAFPEITACPDGPVHYAAEHPTGQINPVVPKTYRVIQAVYDQVAPLFQDPWFHGGSDEINFRCWNATRIITDYLRRHGHKADTAGFDWILNRFITRQHDMLRAQGKTPVVWEEVVLNHRLNYMKQPQHRDTIIQVWTSAENIKKTIQKGYKVIAGSADYWYLDCGFGSWVGNDVNGNSWCDPYKTWQKIYSFNPLLGLTDDESMNVLGGEALLWGEQVDDTNVDSKLWPRASAAAEVLWSGNSNDSPTSLWDGDKQHDNTLRTEEAIPRINEQRFRMVSEGVPAEPLMPMWCVKRPGHCNS